ncbi:alpha/beta hydrolase [Patescibacteria group bacterium]|nr:alpha/beta hydrolase [Patescibacteria group bacterium]
MQKRVFLIHGWGGRPDNHWFPWLSWELKARGFAVEALAMPHADKPKVAEWIFALKNAVGRPNKETYFVGHSLGCVATLRYFETFPKGAEVGGCVFVAGFSGNINIPEIAEFYSLPLDISKAKSHCPKFVTIFSDNDGDIPVAESMDFTAKLGAKAVMEKGKGHFNKDNDVTALPSVFSSLLSFSRD